MSFVGAARSISRARCRMSRAMTWLKRTASLGFVFLASAMGRMYCS